MKRNNVFQLSDSGGEFVQNEPQTKAVVRRFSVKKACKLYLKKTLVQVFSCEFCEIFKRTFFYGTLPVTASAQRYYNVQ